MSRPMLRALLMLISALPFAAVAASQDQDQANDQTRRLIRQIMLEQRIPGLQVAVVKDGQIVLSEAYGLANVENGVRASRDTRFPLNSATKAFTGVAAAQLAQEGRLDLDAPASRYLPVARRDRAGTGPARPPRRLEETGLFIRFGLTTHVLHACNFGGVAGRRGTGPQKTRRVRGGSAPAAMPARELGGTPMEAQVEGVDLLGDAPEWQERALCSQTDPEAFFPEKGGSTREAKRICGRCDVKAECLEYALGHDERFGIWGGLSERERRKLKRRVA